MSAPAAIPGSGSGSGSEPDHWRVARWVVATNGTISQPGSNPALPPRLRIGRERLAGRWADSRELDPMFATGAPELPRSFAVDRWTPQNGLPDHHVESLYAARNGALWVGLPGGFARFDGRRFQWFHPGNTPALRESGVRARAFAEDGTGTLWIALRQGLLRREGNGFVALPAAEIAGPAELFDLAPIRTGGVWIAARTGVWQAHGTTLRRIGDLPDTRRISAGPLGEVIAATVAGINQWDPRSGGWIPLFTNPPLVPASEFRYARSLAWESSGELLVGFLRTVERRRPDGSGWDLAAGPLDGALSAPDFPPPLCFGRIEDLDILAGGPSQTLSLWWKGRREPDPEGDWREIHGVTCLLPDPEGSLWVGTRNGGLARIRSQAVRCLNLEEPPGHDRLLSICEGADGSLWCGTRNGVLQWGRGGLNVFEFGSISAREPVNSIVRVASGKIWATFADDGIIQLATGRGFDAAVNRVRDYFPGERNLVGHGPARVLYQTRNRQFWVGLKSGLLRGDGTETLLDERNGLPHPDVRALHEDREGHLWVGTFGGGLCRLRDPFASKGEPRLFDTFDHRHGPAPARVWAIHEDAERTLWLGTDAGLVRFKDDRFFSFADLPGLIAAEVNQVLEDDDGHLWLGSNHGIVRVSRRDLNRHAEGLRTGIDVERYGTAEGMLVAETNGEQNPSGCKGRDGRLYFVTPKGLAVIDPHHLPRPPPPPRLSMDLVHADGLTVPIPTDFQPDGPAKAAPEAPPPEVRLGPGRVRSLTFEFHSISLRDPESARAEFMLEGLVPVHGWEPAPSEGRAHYANLDPGRYRFRLRAGNAHAALDVIISPRFWQTRAFALSAGLTGLGTAGLAGVIRLRARRRWIQSERRRAVNDERSRLARDLHDTLGARLSTLALEIGADETSAREGVRATLRELSGLIWSVTPEHDTWQGLVDHLTGSAHAYLNTAQVEVELYLPSTLPQGRVSPETRRHLAAAFHESLRNLVQHAQARRAWITVRKDPGSVRIEVEDDGRGFDLSSPPGPANRGLAHMTERLRDVGGECRLSSRPGRGTRVEFILPRKP